MTFNLKFKLLGILSVAILAQGCSEMEFTKASFAPNPINTVNNVPSSDITVKITSAPKSIDNSKNAKFEFIGEVSDGSPVKSYDCKVDGNVIAACDKEALVSALSEGNHKFEVIAYDQNDKASTPASHDWMVDSVGPVASIVSGPKKFTNKKDDSVVFAVNDTGSGLDSIECKIDGVVIANCDKQTMKKDFVNLLDGKRVFTIQATDKAGNKSNIAAHDWLIDTVRPTLAFTNQPAAIANSKNIKFAFEAKDDSSGIESTKCKFANDALKNCTTDDIYVLTDSKHNFYAIAYDLAGNESLPITHEMLVDTTAPKIDFTKTPTNPSNEKSAIFEYTITEVGSGLASYKCLLDGSDFNCPMLGISMLSNLSLGSHTFTVSAIDKAGNQGSNSYTWKIEDLAPKCLQDLYQQPDYQITKKVDILFVTDSSTSLDEEKNAIANGIDSFVAKLPADVDYQIAVLLGHGSLSSYSGKLYRKGSEPVVLSKSSLSLSQIRTYLNQKLVQQTMDNYSDGGEEGLYSLSNLLNDSNYTAAKNQGFFRADAGLAVVFVADENDICAIYPNGVTPVVDGDGVEPGAHTRDCNGFSHEIVYQKLKQRVGSMPLLVTGIVYTNQNTVLPGGENEVGYGYLDLISLANGKAVDLAAGTYAQDLATIGDMVVKKLNLLTEFKLKSNSVDAATIMVKVDGLRVNHTYVSATNEVQISSTDAGKAKSAVAIDYCLNQQMMVGQAN